MTEFPLPGTAEAVAAASAPGAGPGYWAGAPSAAADQDGKFVVAYRVRNGHDGNDQTVVARSEDGATSTTCCRYLAAATASTTRRACPTRATSSAQS